MDQVARRAGDAIGTLRKDRSDGEEIDAVVQQDRDVVQSHREALRRRPDAPDTPLFGRGRLQRRVAAAKKRELRLQSCGELRDGTAGRVAQISGRDAVNGRWKQARQGGREVSGARRTAQQQCRGRLPAQGHLRIGRASEIAVVIVPDCDIGLQRAGERNVRLGEQRQDVARARQRRRRAEIEDVAGLERGVGCLREFLAASAEADGHGQRTRR